MSTGNQAPIAQPKPSEIAHPWQKDLNIRNWNAMTAQQVLTNGLWLDSILDDNEGLLRKFLHRLFLNRTKLIEKFGFPLFITESNIKSMARSVDDTELLKFLDENKAYSLPVAIMAESDNPKQMTFYLEEMACFLPETTKQKRLGGEAVVVGRLQVDVTVDDDGDVCSKVSDKRAIRRSFRKSENGKSVSRSMPFHTGIRLADVHYTTRLLDEPATRYEVAFQIVSAVADFHASNRVHGDLKPENLMLTLNNLGEFEVEIIDLPEHSECIAGEEGPEQRTYTPDFLAPELANNLRGSYARDNFALGITLAGLLFDFDRQRPSQPLRGGGTLDRLALVMIQKLVAENPSDRALSREVKEYFVELARLQQYRNYLQNRAEFFKSSDPDEYKAVERLSSFPLKFS